MIPATIASVLILYWYWRESQPKPGEPLPGAPTRWSASSRR